MSLEEQVQRIADVLEAQFEWARSNAKGMNAPKKEEPVAEAPKPAAKPKPAVKVKLEEPKETLPAPSETDAVTEDDIRQAALRVVRSHPEGKEAGKVDVKRVLKSLQATKIEDLVSVQYSEAVNAFERVLGTYVPDAPQSDDLNEF